MFLVLDLLLLFLHQFKKTPSPAFTSLPVNRFSDKLVPNVPNNMLRNPSFCYFALFSIVSLSPFTNKLDP